MVSILLTLALSACDSPARDRHSDSVSPATPASAKSPEVIRREGNHLLGSGSAYLRQHAHNPVDWRPWGAEALALAAKLDRPIFLSIGYVSCHWCHVMEREVFEQDDVATFLNEHFVSIKVDREERPDLDSVYMDAVLTMTGSGGWPMTVFLTPSLRPFFGGTYFPHDRFLQVIRSVAEQFRAARNEVENRGAEVYQRIAASAPPADGAPFAPDELRAVARAALGAVDSEHGGFRSRTKFPTPIKWQFLLDAFRKWGDAELGDAVRKTLDAMAEGGIHDQIGGGFFRYATEPTWTVPHFEKMLYDDAQLATLYLRAAAALEEPRYRAVGVDTLDFLLRDMGTPEHVFGASFDADTGGKEGATYLFSPAELRSVVGDEPALAALLGITAQGNFEGSNVPTFRGAKTAKPEELARWEKSWRATLLAARRKRPQPSFDSKVVTAWNGLAIGAFAVGYRASGERKYLDAAKDCAEALWRLNRTPSGELARTSNAGHGGEPAVLDDYAFLGVGLVELFEATSDPIYLQRAVELADRALVRFANPAGAWFLTAGAAQEPLGRRIELDDGVEPSGNAALISLLERLGALTGKDAYVTAARSALMRYASVIRQRNIDMAGWLDGALLEQGPLYEIVIAGDGEKLAQAWNGLLPSWTVGATVPGAGPSSALAAVMPPSAEKRARDGVALAYVCRHGSCAAPTSDPVKVRQLLLGGWRR